MFYFFSKQKKYFISILIILMLIPSTLFYNPQKAEAIFGVGDITYDPTNWIENAATAVSTAASKLVEYALKTKEYILDGLAYAVAQAIIHQLVADTVNWINNGFDGNPAYLTNFNSFLSKTEDRVMSDYINDPNSPLKFVCDSFSPDIKRILSQNFYGNNTYQPSCTADSVEENTKNLVDGLNNQWDWNTWDKLTLNQNNNIYGAYFNSSRDLDSRINSKIYQEKTQLDWGQGFKPFTECNDVSYYVEGPNGGTTETKNVCENVTPGTVIAHSLNKAMGAGQDALIQADEIDEIVGALLSQLVKSVLQEGLKNYDTSGLSGEGNDLSGPFKRIKKEIEKSIQNENDYLSIKKESLGFVNEILDFLNKAIKSCSENGKKWLESKISEYQGIKDDLKEDIDLSETNLDKLNELDTKIKEGGSDLSSEDLINIWNDYETIRDEIHTEEDSIRAKAEKTDLESQKEKIESEIKLKCNLN